ncbi:hypothetical protein H5410_040756 [Solanum commersonii]|uniref:Uncharacterized protein n=1 Tax=Solanum commersonii TaxID=4109 RepID=A0A9J5XR25_SOLCO|nr:hypothetical protein H5410_040756 [Solanum commersonii]
MRGNNSMKQEQRPPEALFDKSSKRFMGEDSGNLD